MILIHSYIIFLLRDSKRTYNYNKITSKGEYIVKLSQGVLALLLVMSLASMACTDAWLLADQTSPNQDTVPDAQEIQTPIKKEALRAYGEHFIKQVQRYARKEGDPAQKRDDRRRVRE